MIKKTLPVLILLALSGSLPPAIVDGKEGPEKFYYPETLDLTTFLGGSDGSDWECGP